MVSRFLTISDIRAEYDKLAGSYDELPESAKQCVNPLAPTEMVEDYASCFREGWRWMFDGLRRFQPSAFSALELKKPSLLYAERVRPDTQQPSRSRWACNGFVRLGDEYFVFYPWFRGTRIEECQTDHPAIDRYHALPEGIAAAYYARLEGVEVVHRLPVFPMGTRVLPARMNTWLAASALCRPSKKARADMGAALRAVSDNSSATIRELQDAFSILLDTRPQDDVRPEGDFLLVDQTSRSRRIYHLKDSDFTTLALLNDPVSAIDEYVAHVFNRIDKAFDFGPHLQRI